MKRTYSSFTLQEAMRLIPAEDFTRWQLQAPPRPPSEVLLSVLHRLESFDLQTTEEGKALLIDALLAEVVPDYPTLKVWKATTLEADELTGLADYLITPRRAYVATPLLCVAEAKRDDFMQGRAQCLTEMVACMRINQRDGHAMDVFGIVSNGQNWQFYKLTCAGEVYETDQFFIRDLPELLGALDFVCAECSKNAP